MNQPSTPIPILVIDDDNDMCWAMRRFIESDGHPCVVVGNGEEAIRALGEKSFGMAFVDVKLPDMDGLDLVRKMRGIAPAMPCILVSGFFYEDDDLVQNSLKTALIQGFISKPFQLNQIQKAIQNTLAGR